MVRTLIVADDLAERQRASSALALLDGVEVIEVDGGSDAADLLRGGGIDLIVVDGDLAPKGGFSWLYELREQAEMRGETRPPAIVLTSRVEDDFLAGWAGAEVTLPKPVDGFEVARHVAELTAATA